MNFIKFLLFILISEVIPKLIKVIQITRHGSRTPNYLRPDNFLQNELGQLTILGFNQHILLGQWNRRRYIESPDPLLPTTFTENTIKIITSRYQRTQFSAMGNLIGMYPGITFKVNSENTHEFTSVGQPPILNPYLYDNPSIATINIMEKKGDQLFSTKKCYTSLANKVTNNYLKHKQKELQDMVIKFINQDLKKESNTFDRSYLSFKEKSEIKDNLKVLFDEFFGK